MKVALQGPADAGASTVRRKRCTPAVDSTRFAIHRRRDAGGGNLSQWCGPSHGTQ